MLFFQRWQTHFGINDNQNLPQTFWKNYHPEKREKVALPADVSQSSHESLKKQHLVTRYPAQKYLHLKFSNFLTFCKHYIKYLDFSWKYINKIEEMGAISLKFQYQSCCNSYLLSGKTESDRGHWFSGFWPSSFNLHEIWNTDNISTFKATIFLRIPRVYVCWQSASCFLITALIFALVTINFYSKLMLIINDIQFFEASNASIPLSTTLYIQYSLSHFLCKVHL